MCNTNARINGAQTATDTCRRYREDSFLWITSSWNIYRQRCCKCSTWRCWLCNVKWWNSKRWLSIGNVENDACGMWHFCQSHMCWTVVYLDLQRSRSSHVSYKVFWRNSTSYTETNRYCTYNCNCCNIGSSIMSSVGYLTNHNYRTVCILIPYCSGCIYKLLIWLNISVRLI
jgi:hypothetical protein